MASDDDRPESESRTAVPAAFYRDATAPLPPRDDPHWVEFATDEPSDDLPEWGLMAIPIIIAVVMILHGVLGIILWYLLQR